SISSSCSRDQASSSSAAARRFCRFSSTSERCSCRTRRFLLYSRGVPRTPFLSAPMSEKPEEDFDDDEDDADSVESDEIDVDHLRADIDKRKKTAVKAGEPAWRRLERIREERLTAE